MGHQIIVQARQSRTIVLVIIRAPVLCPEERTCMRSVEASLLT